ncbi:GTP cyclohydrolase II [uncultured Arthrobacter sp.]|uniref:GTP cyclohydrolase II n=1 Tax=uncultured Arthrobacter sp. TaxID=114050 RepID=UPI002606E895|nr:GTP cyclohydrolase II [uncultured Arthrobacter sp.]
MSVHPTQTEPTSAPVGVERVAETVLPTKYGVFRMLGYRDSGGTEHVALVRGDDDGGVAPLVRVHSECLTGDAFGSWRCDCGEQLDAALAAISLEERGVVVYVRGHEGRGIGLLAKLKAYALQDQGVDTVDANTELGLPVDARRYDQAAGILRDLGIGAIRLLSGNPAKEEALEALGIAVVERRGLAVSERTENARYLRTKRARMRHDAVGPDVWASLLDGVVPDLPEDDLVRRYGYLAAASGPIVVGHARQSLDGFVAPRPHAPALPQDPSDEGHVQRLRALADAVVVGASTLSAEDDALTVDEVPGDNPVRVVFDAAGVLPVDSSVLTDDAAPTLWLVAQHVEVPSTLAASVEVVRLPTGATDPAPVLDLLLRRGLDRVLVEGGGATVSGFLEAGLLDRLYCTTVPVLIGDGIPGLRFSGAHAPVQIRTAPVRRFVLGHDTCSEFDLDVSQ